MKENIPLAILHIPHSSTYIPLDVLGQFSLSLKQLDQEKDSLTDSFTDELFSAESGFAEKIIFPISRLVVDPERFIDDSEEPMAKYGMGAIYTKTLAGDRLRRNLNAGEKGSLILRYYLPHQKKISAAVKKALEHNGKCLLIDCHSFPNRAFMYEQDTAGARPDICIGADEYHTPKWLADLAMDLFKKDRFKVSLNKPFSGSFVPEDFNKKNNKVLSIMIKVNRSLYMDEAAVAKNADFQKIKDKLQKIIEKIIEKARNK